MAVFGLRPGGRSLVAAETVHRVASAAREPWASASRDDPPADSAATSDERPDPGRPGQRASVPLGAMEPFPRISEFYGIVIEMHFADRPPPHFHARYAGDEATIIIASGEVLAGARCPGGR
jgi:Domain of unknown function (DUF4160)